MGGDNMAAALNSARFVLGTAAGISEPTRGMQVGVALSVDVRAWLCPGSSRRPRRTAAGAPADRCRSDV